VFSFSGNARADTSEFGEGFQLLQYGGLTFGAKAGAQAEAGVRFEFDATVSTPIVQAVGLGSDECHWGFDKDKKPLFGRDIETWAAVILPKTWDTVTYSMKFYLITRTVFVSTRRESDWTEVTCVLNPDNSHPNPPPPSGGK
jgi:hypothetical protein